jgi:hypothetical protein
MQGSDGFQRFASAGLERLGIEAEDAELAVMGVVDSIYRPHIDSLLDADLDAVEPEPRIDLSRRPDANRAAPGREAEDAAGY